MGILKKIKGSTLMETLVASVLIVIVFMLAGMIMNNIFRNSFKNDTRAIEAHLNELHYLHNNDQLQLPYQEEFGKWTIDITGYDSNSMFELEFEAINSSTNKTISYIINEAK